MNLEHVGKRFSVRGSKEYHVEFQSVTIPINSDEIIILEKIRVIYQSEFAYNIARDNIYYIIYIVFPAYDVVVLLNN